MTSALGSVGSIRMTFPGMHELVDLTRMTLSSAKLFVNILRTLEGLMVHSLATLVRTVVDVPSLALSLFMSETCRFWVS